MFPTPALNARRHWFLRALTIAAVLTLLLTNLWVERASTHGNVQSPASRNFGCYERWGSNHLDPNMAATDPMCAQAWQAEPAAMWNWNGLYRNGVGGNHQAAVPDGQLCSGGRTESGRYNALDTVGQWRATEIGNNFSIRLFDQASHGADYIRVYVTRQGFNSLTTPLGWGNLELVAQIGNTPASQWQAVTGGVQISMPAAASGRTGRHIVYTIWQASHMDQAYYFCSDVRFPGGAADPPLPGPDPDPDPDPGTGGCTATYATASQWSNGFQGDVKVTAGSTAITGWTVNMTWPGSQTVTQVWNATVSNNGATVIARNVGWNGSLAAGATASFGFLGSTNSFNNVPTLACNAT